MSIMLPEIPNILFLQNYLDSLPYVTRKNSFIVPFIFIVTLSDNYTNKAVIHLFPTRPFKIIKTSPVHYEIAQIQIAH